METSPSSRQPSYRAPNNLKCAQKLADAFRRNEVDHTYAIMRMSYLLLRAHATWRDIGLSEKILRDKIENEYLKEAERHLERAREYCTSSAAEAKMATWQVRRYLALANRTPHHIGTTKKELDDITDGKPHKVASARNIVLAFKKYGSNPHWSKIDIFDILRDPKKYPHKKIGVTKKELQKLTLQEAAKILHTVQKERRIEGEASSIWKLEQFLAYANRKPEDIGTSEEELYELAYPHAHHKEKAEEALKIVRGKEPSLYWLSKVWSHARRAKISLKELGTSRAELMEIRKRAPPRY